jgi:hypothetical protein
MHLTILDHAKFEIAVRWRGCYGVPLDHKLLVPTAAAERVTVPAGALLYQNSRSRADRAARSMGYLEAPTRNQHKPPMGLPMRDDGPAHDATLTRSERSRSCPRDPRDLEIAILVDDRPRDTGELMASDGAHVVVQPLPGGFDAIERVAHPTLLAGSIPLGIPRGHRLSDHVGYAQARS